ncbi:DUF1579 domain-containing protein [Lysobacter tyrosinilyticus]
MKIRHLAVLALGVALALPTFAKDKKVAAPPPMSAEQQAAMEAWQKAATPNEKHQQLIAGFEGTWNTKMTSWMDPSAKPQTETGKSVNTPVLGGRQLRMDYTGQAMGQPFEGVGYIGYDNVTGKYFSTWSDNMSTGLFVAHGDYDPASKTYAYQAQMADPMQNGALVPIREVVRVVDADHVNFEMYETRDGKERKSMQIEYVRAK